LRLALGVRRSRLMGQWFTESLILALLGGLVGVIVAHWWGAALRRLFLPDGTVLPVLTDWRTLSVAAALALVAGVMTGLAPALFAGRGDLTGTLKAGAREGTYHRSRTRSALLVAQGALSVVLLVGAALFVRSLSHASAVRLGYDANPLLLVTRNLRGMPMDADEQLALGRRLLHAARTIPGVERAAMASSLPFSGSSVAGLYVAGIDSVRRLGEFTYQTASADYFRTMGTRLLRGRSFAEQDRSGAPLVAVVSEAMARTLWPGRDALGQCMRIFADTMPCTTVVGIAENAVHDLVQDERLRYYLPVDQFPNMGSALLLLRMRGEPGTATEHVRLALQSVMPGQAYVTVQPMRELVAEQRRSWQLGATMFSAFGVLALVVAAIGLYGVIAYSVAQRMHELGVRIALGAQSLDVIGLVIGQGVRLALAGVAAGIALVLAFASALQPLLFQQSANDPAVLGFVAAIMIAVALLASGVPALRATRADPNSVLRAE
jgi:putative ABC transport system permease protein